MILDELKYVLSEKNYIKEETQKTQIVLGHTFNHEMRHFFGWQHRYNGKYNKTAAFSKNEYESIGEFTREFNNNVS